MASSSVGRVVVVRWDGVLDTSLESAVKKVDASTFTDSEGKVADAASIMSIDYDIGIGVDAVQLLFDATANDVALTLNPGSGNMDFTKFGGISNPKSTGYTGDILLTNTGTVGTDFTYQLIVTLKLKY